jgi:hypothetical protein
MKRCMILLAVLGTVGGCAGLLDPYERAGTWSNSGINDDNLRAMVANPLDLQRGAGASGSTATLDVTAVTRYRTGTVKDLPQSEITDIGPSTTSNSGGGAALTGGGGQ